MHPVYFTCETFSPPKRKCYINPETPQGNATLRIISTGEKLAFGTVLPGLVYKGFHIRLKRQNERLKDGRYSAKIQMLVAEADCSCNGTPQQVLGGIQLEATKRGYERTILFPKSDHIVEVANEIAEMLEKSMDANGMLKYIKQNGRI